VASGCGGAGGDTGDGGDGGSGAGTGNGGSTGNGGNGGTTGTLPSCDTAEHPGKITYYNEADGSGACSFDPTPNDLMVGAMNVVDYENAAACGTCVAIQGPNGNSIGVRIVDLCPECQKGHIDLSPDAFAHLADLSTGVVQVTWQYAPCDYQGPLQYKFKEGSNQWWTAVQIRHHAHQIAAFEYQKDGAWVPVARTDYNYFVEDQGMGPGPYTFRVTDIYGHSVVDEGIAFVEGGVAGGKAQLPSCSPP
jgi:expansin (peptidoglycan-binding protein)